MNIRKNINYGDMYAALDHAMAAEGDQMELYCAIGKAVSLRPEKGAAVAAAKYLAECYPDAHGFSPRNIRRMRDFYRTYENHPALLTLALQIGWTQNVVIMEADLSMELREWYLRAAKQFGWSKTELAVNIAENAHEKVTLTSADTSHQPEMLQGQKVLVKTRNPHQATMRIVTWRNSLIKRLTREHNRRWKYFVLFKERIIAIKNKYPYLLQGSIVQYIFGKYSIEKDPKMWGSAYYILEVK